MPQESGTSAGRGRYRGFAVDLVLELSRVIHFNYTFVPVKDARYGIRNEDGNWTGMIGEVARGVSLLCSLDNKLCSMRNCSILSIFQDIIYTRSYLVPH